MFPNVIICIVKLNVMRRGYTLFFRLNFHPDNIMSMNQEKCDDGSTLSLGDPSTPPCSSIGSDCTAKSHIPMATTNAIQDEKDALQYEIDSLTGCATLNLRGEELVQKLKLNNENLILEVKRYQGHCYELEKELYLEKERCTAKIQDVRRLYGSMFLGQSRSAKILRSALNMQ